MLSNINSQQLVIALELEAASIFCRSIEMQNFERNRGSGEIVRGLINMPSKTTYIVVDAGGGTVDITYHEVIDESHVEEIRCPSGDGYGGIRVNRQFEELLCEVLGGDFISKFKADAPREWLSLMTTFENRKGTLKPKLGEPQCIFNVPWGLANIYGSFKGESIVEAFTRSTHLGVEMDSTTGSVCLTQAAVDRLFLPVVQDIINHLCDVLNVNPSAPEAEGPASGAEGSLFKLVTDYILMVGGFSECRYLYEAMQTTFGPHILSILKPPDCNLAVVKGAVMYGNNPDSILYRRARKTYGTGTHLMFREGEHDERKKVEIDGLLKCKDVFHHFITKNELVKRDEKRTFTFLPLRADNTTVDFKLYSSKEDNVEYIDQPGVEPQPGKLEVLVPVDPNKGKERPVKVQITFGGTELAVRAEDKSREGEDAMETKLDFLLS